MPDIVDDLIFYFNTFPIFYIVNFRIRYTFSAVLQDCSFSEDQDMTQILMKAKGSIVFYAESARALYTVWTCISETIELIRFWLGHFTNSWALQLSRELQEESGITLCCVSLSWKWTCPYSISLCHSCIF